VTAGGVYLARGDRLALCRLLESLGPDAPTLCEGWTGRDLAAHLVARDRRPDSVPGLVVPVLAGWTERVRRGELRHPFEELVASLRGGPPAWSPLALAAADRAGNTHEFFVHYEDVRRAQPGWQPREFDDQAERDLWRVLGWFAGRAFRTVPVGLALRSPGGQSLAAGKGTPEVTLTGRPGELLLYAFGRRNHALVDIDGPPAAVDRLRSASLSW
jgi:uncharacterized protein (TIGR03085 family)